MAKRVNKNMVAGLTAVAFLVMTVGMILMIKQLQQTDPEPFVERAKQHQQRADELVNQGDWDGAQGEWGQARMLFQKAFYVSKDPAYMVEAGQIAYRRGDEGEARQIWERALAMDPQLEPALIHLCEFYAKLAKYYAEQNSPSPQIYERLLEKARALENLDKENAFAVYCRGLALVGLAAQHPDNREQGLVALKRAREIAPENVEFGLTLAGALLRGRQADSVATMEEQRAEQEQRGREAEDLFKQLVDANTAAGEEASRIRGLYADLLSQWASEARAGDQSDRAADLSQRALALYEEGINLAGEDPAARADARIRLANYWIRSELRQALREDPDSAATQDVTQRIESLLREAIDVYPAGFTHFMRLADLYAATGQLERIIPLCQERIELGIERTGMRGAEQKKNLYLLLLRAAETSVAQAIGLEPGDSGRNTLLAQAQTFVDAAAAEAPGTPHVAHMEGRILLTQGKDLDALAKFEEADAAFARPHLENKGFLAAIYLNQGQVGAALEAAEYAVRSPRASVSLWLTYARALLRNNEPQKAVDAAQTILKSQPNNRDARLIQVEAYNRLDRPDLAARSLEQLPQDDPKTVLMQAQTLARAERYDEALALLDPILKADPANFNGIRIAVGIHQRQEDSEAAAAVVAQGLEAAPDDINLQKMAVALDTSVSAEERAERFRQVLERIDDGYTRAVQLADFYIEAQELEAAQEQLLIAERHLTDRDTPEARNQMQQHGERAAREIMLRRFRLVCSRKAEGWQQAAREIVEQAKQRNIDGADGLTFLGQLQLLDNTPDAAIDSFRQAIEKQPNNSDTLALLGRAYLTVERIDQARQVFERAAAINPNNSTAHRGLAMIARGRVPAVFREHLRECQRLIPNDAWVKSQSALLEEERFPEKGIERRLKLLETAPEDVSNLLALATNYLRLEEPDVSAASQYFDRALELAPADLGVAQQVARFHQAQGESDQAVAVLRSVTEAQEQAADKATGHLLIGSALRATGDLAAADAAYLAAADTDDNSLTCLNIGQHFMTTSSRGSERLEQALEWLGRAVAKADEAPGENPRQERIAQDARNMRVECLIHLDRPDEAMQGVNDLLERFPDNPMPLLLRATIEVEKGEVEAAIESLTRFLEKSPDHELALYRRASLYQSQTQWSSAIKDLERLKSRHPEALNLRPRLRLAMAYERTGRLDVAVSELTTLLDEHPDNLDVINSLLQLYTEHEQFDEADRLITIMVNRNPEEPFWRYRRGDLAIIRDDRTRAKDDLLAAVRAGDFNPVFVARLLEAFEHFADQDEGIAFFEDQLPEQRRDPRHLEQYATLLAMAGRAPEAVEQYRRSIMLMPEPDFAFLRKVATDAYRALGADDAVTLFRNHPADPQAARANREVLALMLSLAGQTSEAISILEDLLSTTEEPGHKATLWLLVGMLANQSEDFVKARHSYEQTLKLTPDNWVALNNLAFLLSDKLGLHEEALPYARRASVLSNLGTVTDTYGMILSKLGQHRRAVGVLSKAIQQDARLVAGYLHLGDAYRQLGEFNEARNLLLEAQKLIDLGFGQDDRAAVESALERARNRDSGS